MAYLNDPRENRIGSNGELWENDKREEERYLWNGAYLDLCDLPPEEYMKTIFVTSEGGSSGGNEGGDQEGNLKENENLIKIVESVDKTSGKVTFSAIATKPVKEETTVTANVRTSNGGLRPMRFVILKNTTQSTEKQEVSFTQEELVPRTEEVNVKPTEITNPETGEVFINVPEKKIVKPSLYTISKKGTEIQSLIESGKFSEVLKSARKTTIEMEEDKKSFSFMPEYEKVPNTLREDATGPEIDQFVAENSSVIYIITDKEIKDICTGDEGFSISDFENWDKNEAELTEEDTGIKYYIWSRTDTGGSQISIEGLEEETFKLVVYYK